MDIAKQTDKHLLRHVIDFLSNKIVYQRNIQPIYPDLLKEISAIFTYEWGFLHFVPDVELQSTLDISNCQRTNKFVRDIESSIYRVVILCKLIRTGPIVLFETLRVRLIEYSRYRVSTEIFNVVCAARLAICRIALVS